jgi:hypothetical protein
MLSADAEKIQPISQSVITPAIAAGVSLIPLIGIWVLGFRRQLHKSAFPVTALLFKVTLPAWIL